jgi:ATP-dependent exoDNAse (exonuclease V) beta subunit
MATKSNDKDQEAAIGSLQNTVVTAGAGSGKTTVLVNRFVRLLETQDASIDEILTLTFTNKAAAEMYERIYKALLAAENPRLKQALLDFHKAQISTIDSFSAQVARASAARFGLPPDFIIDEEAAGRLAGETALDFYLAHARRPSVEAIVGRSGLDGLCSAMLSRMAVSYLTLAEEADFPGLLRRQYAFIEEAMPARLAALEAVCAALRSPDFAAYKTIEVNRDALARLEDLGELVREGKWTEVRERLTALALKKPGGKASETTQLLKDLIDEERIAALALDQLAQAFVERDLKTDFYELLGEFQTMYHERKRAAGLVSFMDVARMAVVALRENRPLREYYKARFRFIMIDEFQDNNHVQKELLYLLAEKRSLALASIPGPDELEPDKLFFVGDEKQSIYGFRGAEVDVFKALQTEVEEHGGRVVHLAKNYRSRPGLIAFFNRVFARVMDRPEHDFEAGFEALQPAVAPGVTLPTVTLLYKNATGVRADDAAEEPADDGETEFSRADSEAFAIASFIRDAVEAGSLPIETDGLTRPAGYADFALLLRSTGNQMTFERMFRHLGVPYETQSVRSLFIEPPVNDIYALLQCALHPEDRTAYATLLRSPLAGVSDAALLTVLAAESAPFAAIDLPADDAAQYERGREAYEAVRSRIDLVPVSRLVFFAWYELGYRYFILRTPSAAMYLEYYDYLYALALRADTEGQTLDRFLSWVRGNLGQFEKLEDFELARSGNAGVRIMTIHKAKGLQFPVVVGADLGNRGHSRARSAPIHFSRRFGPVVSLGEGSFLADLSAEEEEAREEAELKRLFYVALTRAQHHLVLSGVYRGPGGERPKDFLSLLFRALELDPDNPDRFGASEYEGRVRPIPDLFAGEFHRRSKKSGGRDLAALEKKYRAAPGTTRRWRCVDWSVTELNDLYKKSFPEKEYERRARELPATAADRHLTTDEARARWGTLAHRVMHDKLLGRYDASLLPAALHSGFGEGAFDALRTEAERVADVFLASSWGERFARAAEKETEFPFLFRYVFRQDEYFIRGDIDLYFIEGDRAWLLDFKTDRSLNPIEYEVQLGIYSAALASLHGQSVSASLYSLRSGETIELPDGFDLARVFERIGTALLPVEF